MPLRKHDPENAPSRSVNWRLPLSVAEEHEGDWSAFRELLDAWAESGEKLEPEVPEETTSCCFRVDPDTLEALEKEAKRLTKKTGKRWTAGRVARGIWDQSE